MDFSNIKGIIFDYGGTIDSRGDHWSHILRKGWEVAGIDASDQQFREAYVHAERQLAKVRHIDAGDSFHTLLRKKIQVELDYFIENGGRLSGKDDVEDAALKIADYCNRYALECVEEARPVLEALAAKYPLVLVSNFYGNVDAVLRAFGIRKYFNGIIESSVVGIRKPDPRIFMLGVVALGLKPDEVLVVGDSLKKDILPARSIGCRTAWIKGRGWTPEEDAADDPALIPELGALLELTRS